MSKKLRKILIIILSAVFLFSLGMTLLRQIQYREIDRSAAEAAELAGLNRPRPSSPPPPRTPEESPPEPLPEEAEALAYIDFETLRGVNRDVFGWIYIPETEISYPMVQYEDNRHYLTHDWKDRDSVGGAIFLESTNKPDLTDYHTLIYGHRMKNGSMFAGLRFYEEQDYWREHPNVYLALETGIYRCEIFSAHKTTTEDIVYQLEIKERGAEEEFLSWCLEKSVIDTGIVPTKEERIVTLSTCTAGGWYVDRWVVHARLASVYAPESPED